MQECSTLLYVHGGHSDYQGRGAQDVHLHFHSHVQLRNSEVTVAISTLLYVHEATATTREPRTSTSTFTHTYSSGTQSDCSYFNVALRPRGHSDYQGAQDVHLHFHTRTAPELRVTVAISTFALRPRGHSDYQGAQDVHLHFHSHVQLRNSE